MKIRFLISIPFCIITVTLLILEAIFITPVLIFQFLVSLVRRAREYVEMLYFLAISPSEPK
jgi:hypothetical protein